MCVVPEVLSCLFCHNTKVHNHYSHIIKTGRYGWSMDHAGAANPPSPLFSPFCFISSPLSISVHFMRPPCPSATECHPRPLPVSFIKPVRDEVKPWRQLFSLVSFFSCGWTPQAAGWSTARCSLMTEVSYWSIDSSASNTKAPLGLLTTLEREGSWIQVWSLKNSPSAVKKNYTSNAAILKQQHVTKAWLSQTTSPQFSWMFVSSCMCIQLWHYNQKWEFCFNAIQNINICEILFLTPKYNIWLLWECELTHLVTHLWVIFSLSCSYNCKITRNVSAGSVQSTDLRLKLRYRSSESHSCVVFPQKHTAKVEQTARCLLE